MNILTSPPARIKHKWPLGTYINYHHRTAVARIAPAFPGSKDFGWRLFEGVNREELISVNGNISWDSVFALNYTRYMFFDHPKTNRRNKSVFIWPEIGTGYVMGLVRRSMGQSSKGYHDSFSGEFEPGYHVSEGYVDLYAIKLEYYGTDYILCPMWAVQKNKGGSNG